MNGARLHAVAGVPGQEKKSCGEPSAYVSRLTLASPPPCLALRTPAISTDPPTSLGITRTRPCIDLANHGFTDHEAPPKNNFKEIIELD
ncbi:hypothetical protein MUK42_34664 [Musa troglodytarum]|uniref:Uncharacterized protein n=1 Tax=Musa troglodytarum TaxID=320322 RepID=A0A9E7E7N8_9LILI|nr:hypothetical protein MUK42_34664 [Musa troglodytarum]